MHVLQDVPQVIRFITQAHNNILNGAFVLIKGLGEMYGRHDERVKENTLELWSGGTVCNTQFSLTTSVGDISTAQN